MKKQLLLAAIFISISGMSSAQFWSHTEPVKLEGTVNTDAEESIPVFSKDSSMLYFVRTFDGDNTGGETDQDIWFSKKEATGSYSACARLKKLNNKFNNAVLGLGANGSTMYLLNAYDGKKDQTKGLAFATGDGTDWDSPKKIDIPSLDIEGDFYGFHVAEGGEAIIISYNGPGSKGEEDLYVTTKAGNSWSAPVHMGSTINSAGYEISPFLSPDGDTMFFSSNGFGGEGDADIFYTVKQGSWTSWSTPVNLGSSINSPKFDAYFSYAGSQAFWSSNKEDDRSDIYMINILTPPTVSIACSGVDASSFGLADGRVDATVEGGVAPFVFEWSNGQSSKDASGLKMGEYTVTVTDNLGQTATSTCAVGQPDPINVSVIIEINEIKFDLDKSNIREDAALELDKIVQILNDNPKMVIELGAHTDCRGSASYNKRLSERRAQSSAAYIKKRISNPQRITSSGYGETKLLNGCACEGENESNCTDEQHQENRRTEFKIVEVGSDEIIIKNNSNNSFED